MAVISIMGPIGAGKTEQATRLAALPGWVTFSTGQLVREDNNPDARAAARAGRLAPTDYVQDLVLKKIATYAADQSIVLDGSPRMLPEAERLDTELPHLGRKLDLIIFLDVHEDQVAERLARRGRHDDAPEIIHVRWQEYQRDTMPVVARYERAGIVRRVDGGAPMEQVQQQIALQLKEAGLVD